MPIVATSEQRKQWANKIYFTTTLKKKAIFCVSNKLEARIAENAGAAALIAVDGSSPIESERVNVGSRVVDKNVVQDIMDFVSVPVFGRIHAGSEVEVKYLKEARINGIDELEFASTLSGATLHVNKLKYDNLPFICGATCLSQAIRRVEEGASMICIKGSAYDDTPNPAQAIEDIERIQAEIATVFGMAGDDDALRLHASRIGANYNYVKQVAQLGRLPVPLFAAGGITQPSDAAHMLEMGCDGVIISNFLFKTPNPAKRASAIISAIACPSNHGLLAAISEDLE